MRHLITCLGEILIDFLPINEGGSTAGFRMYPGGAPLNVAVGVARLGQPVAFAGKLARDFFGRVLRAYVERERIDPRFLIEADALSTLAFVAVEHGEPVFSFYGEGAADTLLTAADLPAALFEETAVLHVGGISLLRGTTPAAALAAVERLQGQALISFDPNVRPGLVRDETSYRALLNTLFKQADIIKVSATDLAWLTPGASADASTLASLLGQGAALAVLTQGGAGVLAQRSVDPEPLHAPVFQVMVADTVGAGDTFNAGLLSALAERGALSRAALLALPASELAACLRFASAAAALACARPGADPPRRSEVVDLLGRA